MNENDVGKPENSAPTPPVAKPEEKIAHCKAGYDNSQSVVRFLDTKATAVIGAIPIVVGALSALFGLVKDWANWGAALGSSHACALWLVIAVAAGVAAIMLVFGVLAVISAFNAITPRNTGDAKPSVLFPLQATYKHAPPDDDFAARVRYIKAHAGQDDILEDYERQLVRMSEIVAEKLGCVNRAVKRLKAFFVLAAVLLGLFFAATLLSAILGAVSVPAAVAPRGSQPATTPAPSP